SIAAAQANYWIGWAAFEAKDYKNAIAPLDAARQLDHEQFFERGTQRIFFAYLNLEERDPLAREVDAYVEAHGKGKVPADILRFLGAKFFEDKDFENAQKYFQQL